MDRLLENMLNSVDITKMCRVCQKESKEYLWYMGNGGSGLMYDCGCKVKYTKSTEKWYDVHDNIRIDEIINCSNQKK